jgi:hypothetical protein
VCLFTAKDKKIFFVLHTALQPRRQPSREIKATEMKENNF